MDFQFTKNVRSGLFWLGLFKFAGQLFIWANTIIIAHFLDPKDYGLVGMASLITTFVLLIGNFGFGLSVVQKKDVKENQIYSLFWLTFGIGILFFILLYYSAPICASFFKKPEVTSLLRFSAVALFLNIISEIPSNIFIKHLKYKYVGLIDFLSNFLASLSVLLFAINGFGAHSLIYGSIISGLLKFSLSCYLGKWFPKFVFQRQGLRWFFNFGGAVVIDRILWYTYSNADFLILAKKLGEYAFGLYSFAFNLACIPTNKLQPILYPVLFSSFSRIQDDLPQMRRQYLKIVRIGFVFYAMLYSGIFWVIPEFVRIFLGSKWEPIIPILQILLLIQPVKSVGALGQSFTHALGRPDVGATNMAIFVVVMVPSFYIASSWGMIAVALVWCTVYPFVYMIALVRGLRVAGISLKSYFPQYLPGLRLTLIVSVAIFLFKLVISQLSVTNILILSWVKFLGTISVGCIVNFSILWNLEKDLVHTALAFVKRENM